MTLHRIIIPVTNDDSNIESISGKVRAAIEEVYKSGSNQVVTVGFDRSMESRLAVTITTGPERTTPQPDVTNVRRYTQGPGGSVVEIPPGVENVTLCSGAPPGETKVTMKVTDGPGHQFIMIPVATRVVMGALDERRVVGVFFLPTSFVRSFLDTPESSRNTIIRLQAVNEITNGQYLAPSDTFADVRVMKLTRLGSGNGESEYVYIVCELVMPESPKAAQGPMS